MNDKRTTKKDYCVSSNPFFIPSMILLQVVYCI